MILAVGPEPAVDLKALCRHACNKYTWFLSYKASRGSIWKGWFLWHLEDTKASERIFESRQPRSEQFKQFQKGRWKGGSEICT
jgi:hypothetical protein